MFRIPGGVGFDHGVEDHQQHSHAGGDDDLAGFARFLETLGELTDHRIELFGDEGRHGEDFADRGSSSVDRATTLKAAAVTAAAAPTAKAGGATGDVRDCAAGRCDDWTRFCAPFPYR